jgi:hypothetical protein
MAKLAFREGSRKAKTYSRFLESGEAVAKKYAKDAGIQESTLKTWFATWKREGSKPAAAKGPAKAAPTTAKGPAKVVPITKPKGKGTKKDPTKAPAQVISLTKRTGKKKPAVAVEQDPAPIQEPALSE